MKADVFQVTVLCVALGTVAGPLGAGESGPGVTIGASNRPDVTVPAGTTVRAGKDGDAVGNVTVEPGGTLDLHGQDTRVQGLSGSGAVVNGGKTPATLTIEGGSDLATQTFSGTVTDGPGGAPLSLKKIRDARQVTTAP